MDKLGLISSIFKEIKTLVLSRQIFAIAFFIGLGSLFLLNFSDNMLNLFHLLSFRDRYVEIIGVISYTAFFVVFSGLIYYGWNWIYNKGKRKYETNRDEKNKLKLLESLTPVECSYLAYYLLNKSQTAYFAPSDGVIGGLEVKNILYKSSTIGTMNHWAYLDLGYIIRLLLIQILLQIRFSNYLKISKP